MAQGPSQRISVTLDAVHAEQLARLAEQAHLQVGPLAKALPSTAIDDAPPHARDVTELPLQIPGAMDRHGASIAAADRVEVVPLEDL